MRLKKVVKWLAWRAAFWAVVVPCLVGLCAIKAHQDESGPEYSLEEALPNVYEHSVTHLGLLYCRWLTPESEKRRS